PWTMELDADDARPALAVVAPPPSAVAFAGPAAAPVMVELPPSGGVPRAAMPPEALGNTAPSAAPLPAAPILAPSLAAPAAPACPAELPPARRVIRFSVTHVVAGLWLVGCVGVLLRLLIGTLSISRLAAASRRVVDGRWLSLTQRLALDVGIARPLTLLDGD